MEERFENIDEFKTSASAYKDLSTIEALNEFLESISLVADIDKYSELSAKAEEIAKEIDES